MGIEAEKIIKIAEMKGANQAEVFIYSDGEISASISRGGRISASSSTSKGVGIRVIVKGREGFSYTSKLSSSEVEKTVERAIKIALKSGRKLQSLPEPSSTPGTCKFYCGQVMQASVDEVFQILKEVFDRASRYEGFGRIVSCRSEVRWVSWRVINSLGLDFEFKETHNAISFSAIAAKNGLAATHYDYMYSRSLIGVEEAEVKAMETIKMAEKGIPEVSIESGEYPVILSPTALVTLLNYTLYPVLTAKFQPRRFKAGENIGSEKLTIIEDPLNPMIPRSSPADHEGTVRSEKAIIEEGKLKTLLYDQYYAEIEGRKSTGNGFRTPILTWPRMLKPYQAAPSPEVGSMVIKAGSRSVDDLASRIEHGLYVINVIGAHGADPASGRFSATASIAFKIEGGSIGRAVKHAIVGGSLNQLLNIIELSGEGKLVYNTIAPSVLIEKLRIAGERH